MEKRYLIPLSEYILGMGNTSKIDMTDDECFSKIFNYTRFIIQPIKLGDFIPCDLDGNVLEKPMNHDKWLRNDQERRGFNNSEHEQFQEAESRVLFEGFELDDTTGSYHYIHNDKTNQGFMLSLDGSIMSSKLKTREDLTHLNLELTDNALKV